MALNDTFVRSVKADAKPRKHTDGGGLYLFVPTNGSKLWRQAYGYGGKQRVLSHGQYPAVSLAAARKARDAAKELLAKATKRATGASSGRPLGRRAEIADNAAKGILPPVPDFSAETHKRFRGKLAEIVKLVEAGEVAALKSIEIKPYSSSPKAMARYRDLAVQAIEARQKKDAE